MVFIHAVYLLLCKWEEKGPEVSSLGNRRQRAPKYIILRIILSRSIILHLEDEARKEEVGSVGVRI